MDSDNSETSEEGNSLRIYPRKDHRSDLQKWPILDMLPPQFLEKIRTAFVYCQEVLVVTNDDKVYAVGQNSLGCLNGANIGENKFFYPREVIELSGRGIKTFQFCKDSTVVALGKDGTMYYSEGVSFVKLDMKQMVGLQSTGIFGGYGLTERDMKQMVCLQSNGISEEKMVVRTITCQHNQIFTLLENGRVYVWKKDQSLITLTSKLLVWVFHIIHIEATRSSCIAVTAVGDLYVWANSVQDQYPDQVSSSLFNNSKAQYAVQEQSKKISFPSGVKIEKAACGYDHILALSDSGHVYAWGANASGQLGYIIQSAGTMLGEMNIIKDQPQKVSIPTMGQVVDIAATNHCNISVAATSCGEIFMWGDCNGIKVPTPIITPYNSFHDVFVKFARVKLMHRPLTVAMKHENSSILQNLETAFDDPETSDFIIEVGSKPIRVHKAILKINSDYFRRMFATDWAENTKDVIEHKEFSYDVYKAFLKYLYTGGVDLPPLDALELLRLAHQYLDDRLQRLCMERILSGLRVSNAIRVLVIARQYSIEDLERISRNFILNHLTEVVGSEDFLSLDGEIAKELMRQAADKGVFKK